MQDQNGKARRMALNSTEPTTRLTKIHWRDASTNFAAAGVVFYRRRAGGARAAHPLTSGGSIAGLSQFEHLAAESLRLTHGSEDIFGTLLIGAYPPLASDGWIFRGLWNEEAMRRASRMLQLLLRLHARKQRDASDWRLEYVLASHLAADYRSLSAVAENHPADCSGPLRSICCNLTSLFGPLAGNVEFNARAERISLPAYRRRALVLAASELVTNVLADAFVGNGGGRIDICLQRVDNSHACLRVSNDGAGPFECSIDTFTSLAGRLGRLFEGRLTYRRDPAGITAAEIAFPLPS